MKLFRPGNYPVVRGSALMLDEDKQAFLWTAGYAPRLDTYLGPETPNPVHIRLQRGECSFRTILQDVMGLTKINFNSCLHNDRLPVTIRFADAVGEIMLAAPQTGEPRLPFKFYI
jgi:argonaute-like protein implicated in RNA metabolism and viral defense